MAAKNRDNPYTCYEADRPAAKQSILALGTYTVRNLRWVEARDGYKGTQALAGTITTSYGKHDVLYLSTGTVWQITDMVNYRLINEEG